VLVRQKAVGAAAHDLSDRLEGGCGRNTLWHDGGHVGSRSCQSLRQMRKWPLQLESHGAVIRRRQLFGSGHQRTGEADAQGKAVDAGDDIACQHRFLVVKT
jgi:hypothetical protein